MKPAWQTSEFWITLITKLLAVACVAGVVKGADEQHLAETATKAIMGVFSILAAAKVICEYIKGRHSQTIAHITNGSGKTTAICLALAVWLLPSFASAQPVQKTCFGCRCGRQQQPQTDPAVMAILQQISNQQQQILMLLQAVQQHPTQPQPAPAPQFIVLGPQLGGPRQEIPLGGPPRQDIPLGGPPRQDIPLGGPPKQDIPLGGPPRQELPLGPPPRQEIPLGPTPQQSLPREQQAQPPQQQIPLGPKAAPLSYQRYTLAPQTYAWRAASR